MAANVISKLTTARAKLVMDQPFFGSLALRLRLEASEDLSTAGCDGRTLFYNPAFVDKLNPAELKGLLAHETMHPAMLHHTRRGSRERMRWNMAADYAINKILDNARFQLPPGALLDPKYDGMSAEEIYDKLPKDAGEGLDPFDPGNCGAVLDASPSDGDEQSAEVEWKQAVAQAAMVAKQQGKLPADIERLIGEIMTAVLPWRDLLRAFMTERAADDFSWARGNRRFLSGGLYLPSRISDSTMGEMLVAIDTSGSIGDKELTAFASEVTGIVADAKPSKLIVLYCDADVAHVDEFVPGEELHFAPHGGGGTDFRPPFQWVREHAANPRCLVYLTDGYGPFPDDPPDYPTMWCITNHTIAPPWGEHLVLEVEA